MHNKGFYELLKETNFNSFNKKFSIKEINLINLLENENDLNYLRTNPNSPLKTFFTTDSIKKLIRYCIKFDPHSNKCPKINSKIINNLCQILCSPCVLLFNKSILNIKYANKFVNSDKNKKNIEKNNNEEEYEENEWSNLEKILFKRIEVNNNIISSSYFCINENINDNKDSYSVQYKKKNSNENEHINKKDIFKYVYGDEEIKIINEILDEIFNSLIFANVENENSNFFYFQKIVNYLLCFESDTIINYLIKDTNSKYIKFLERNLNRAEILNILENILNILSDDDKEPNKNNNINYKFSAQIIQDLVNLLIQECQNNRFDKVDYICELIINTVINNSESQLIELFIKNDSLIQKIKKLIKDIVNKNSLRYIYQNEKALVDILEVLCQLNNVIVASFNESNFYKDNKKDINIVRINDYKINIFEYKKASKKSISYENIFMAFKDNSTSYLSNIKDIYILISEDIKKHYKINMNNKNKDNQKIGLSNLIKWKFILSCLKLYIYSFYAIKDFNNANFDEAQYFSQQDLLEIVTQNYLKFPPNNLYLNIFLEIIKLICCEKCPQFLISPFLKVTNEGKQNEFILQLKNSLEIYLNKNQYELIGPIVEILRTFYISPNTTIINFFNNSDVDNFYKKNFIDCMINKLERNLNEGNDYSISEIFNIDDDDKDTFDGNDSECSKDSFYNLIGKFIRRCII